MRLGGNKMQLSRITIGLTLVVTLFVPGCKWGPENYGPPVLMAETPDGTKLWRISRPGHTVWFTACSKVQ